MRASLKTTLPALGAALALAGAVPAAAQLPLSARSLGMAGADLGVARGYEALYANPANLALPGAPRWSFGLGQILAGGTVSGPSLGMLPDLVGYDDLSDDRKRELLDAIPATGVESQIDVRAPLAALQVGPVALGLAYGATGQGSVGKDLVELLLNGYEEGRTDYSVGNTAGSRMTYWDAALALGHRVGPVSLGVTGHYFRAGTTARTRLFEPRVDVEAQDVEVDLVTVLARGGSGYGVDFGASLEAAPSLTVSASVTNAVTKLRWSEDLRLRTLTLSRADLDAEDPATLLDRYEESERPIVDNVASQRVYQTAEGLYDGAYFPATLRVGAGWQPAGGTSLSGSYAKQLTDGRLDGSWAQTVAVGAEQRLWIFGVRGGYATNLDGGSLVSGGLRLGPMNLGLARLQGDASEGAAHGGWIASAGLGVSVGGR
jgi:hypothetical protein